MNYEIVLPIVFLMLMGLSILMYAILDGYDLGVGILLPLETSAESQRDTMIASIGPFWDANETWLVLAVGLLLIAFPEAHSLVLYQLYIPAVLMLCGLILRGVSFDFRAKAVVEHKQRWDSLFKLGSILTSLMQGYMLGQYVIGFDTAIPSILFCIVSALCVTAAYSFIGAAWLIMKTTGSLQQRAFVWTRRTAWLCAFGILLVSVVNPLVSDNVLSLIHI